jgi:hypothetical protein
VARLSNGRSHHRCGYPVLRVLLRRAGHGNACAWRLIPSLRNKSYSTGIIDAHPCKQKRKDGAPSVEMLHIEMVKGGPPADKSPSYSLTMGRSFPMSVEACLRQQFRQILVRLGTSCVLKLVHEGKIVWRYVSLIALLAHPAFSRITIPEHPSVDMLVA